jgi:hypothetical protein
MRKQIISDEIKDQIEARVDRFNRNIIKDPQHYYNVHFSGMHLYLDRIYFGAPSPICRLKYTGHIDDWGFAIYKFSKDKYDPDEWMFPGSGHVDGTVEGAMKAGLEAYPTSDKDGISLLKSVIQMFFGKDAPE